MVETLLLSSLFALRISTWNPSSLEEYESITIAHSSPHHITTASVQIGDLGAVAALPEDIQIEL